MNNRSAAQSYGWNFGILSGLFAILQVLISASAARGNIYLIESLRLALDRLSTGGGNPVPLIGSLAVVVLITYGSIIVTGAISLVLSWNAGRLTAYVTGDRSSGAGAGFRVALLSGGIWIVFTILISLLWHSDGTITGVLASSQDGSHQGSQLIGLLFQELILAAIGLGLGAWAGHAGAGRAPLDETAAPAVAPMAIYGGYAPYPAYPPASGTPTNGSYSMPAQSAQPTQPVYPPPPNYYRPPAAQTPPATAEQPPQSSGTATDAPTE